MIECPVCGADADESMRFCTACGSQLIGGPPTQAAAATQAADGAGPVPAEYPAAGWCDTCQGFVWVDADWACQFGHPRSVVSRWYDPVTGERLSPPWREQLVNPEGEDGSGQPVAGSVATAPQTQEAVPAVAQAPEPDQETPPGPGTRLGLLAQMREALNVSRMHIAEYGEDTDLVVTSIPSDQLEEYGLAHTEYSAILKAVEQEKTAYMWEMLKESSGGLAFGGIETDLHTPDDIIEATEESGGMIPADEGDAEIASTTPFDYRDTRDMIAQICSQHGWSLEIVLRRQAATW